MSKLVISMLNSILEKMDYGTITLVVQHGKVTFVESNERHKVIG